MAFEVSRQTVSPETIQVSSAAPRPSQSIPENTKQDVEAANSVRQTVAPEEAKTKDLRQQSADAGDVVVQLREKLQSVTRQLEFRIDQQSGETIIKVKDRDTGEIIREIPSEEMIEIGHRLRELAETLHSSGTNTEKNIAGLLVQKQA